VSIPAEFVLIAIDIARAVGKALVGSETAGELAAKKAYPELDSRSANLPDAGPPMDAARTAAHQHLRDLEEVTPRDDQDPDDPDTES
jgi:hypothetical protein